MRRGNNSADSSVLQGFLVDVGGRSVNVGHQIEKSLCESRDHLCADARSSLCKSLVQFLSSHHPLLEQARSALQTGADLPPEIENIVQDTAPTTEQIESAHARAVSNAVVQEMRRQGVRLSGVQEKELAGQIHRYIFAARSPLRVLVLKETVRGLEEGATKAVEQAIQDVSYSRRPPAALPPAAPAASCRRPPAPAPLSPYHLLGEGETTARPSLNMANVIIPLEERVDVRAGNPRKTRTNKTPTVQKVQQDAAPPAQVSEVSFADEMEKRYLNYAMTVIQSRALPDVRDGLKPVHRRILYAMYHNLKLLPGQRHRKSATVVGEVMGKYHPHGDTSIYDAMVRMAQPFAMLHPLVDGSGNFGSVDGDRAAAMRYTEARLQPISLELLEEAKYDTVEMRDNFDGTLQEPVVLPAQFPNLLVNGGSGVAVGMATDIPPHNLGEVLDATLYLMDHPDAKVKDLLTMIKGPDFPTGGEIVASLAQRIEAYEKGQGGFVVRGTWTVEEAGRRNKEKAIVVTSLPYGVKRTEVVEKISDLISQKKDKSILDVRDESSEETRIVIEVKASADPSEIMEYLYKNTHIQARVSMNMTCLIPTDNPQVTTPERLSLKKVLQQFIGFRLDVIVRRFRNKLKTIQDRAHVLHGFRIIFEDLPAALAIIQAANRGKDAGAKLKEKFKLTDKQVDAILDARLSRIARMEIADLVGELRGLRQSADEITAILGSRKMLMAEMRREYEELRRKFAQPRRSVLRDQ